MPTQAVWMSCLYCEKLNRSATNQGAGFLRIPDRKTITHCYSLKLKLWSPKWMPGNPKPCDALLPVSIKNKLWLLHNFPNPKASVTPPRCCCSITTKTVDSRHTVLMAKPANEKIHKDSYSLAGQNNTRKSMSVKHQWNVAKFHNIWPRKPFVFWLNVRQSDQKNRELIKQTPP